jgi:hypothetical protein
MNNGGLSDESVAQALSLFMLLGGVALLLNLFNGILQAISFFRRPETLEKTLSEYAKASDVAAMELRVSNRLDGIHTSLVEERTTNRTLREDLLRSLGRIEGELASKKVGP